MQGSAIGVGPALRKARERKGLSLDEASRDTRIRTEFLDALEREEFDSLSGDVYVRGSLRTYSNYLGLNADRVVSAYTSRVPEETAPAPPSMAGPLANPVITTPNTRRHTRLAVAVAATGIVIAASLGALSRSNSSPAPAHLPTTPPPVEAGQQITASLLATRRVDYVVTTDGQLNAGTLHAGEQRAFTASEQLTIHLSRGDSAKVTVNGDDRGSPGSKDKPWSHDFSFAIGGTPSPTG